MKKIKRIVRRLNRFATKKYPHNDVRIVGLEVEDGYDEITIIFDDQTLDLHVMPVSEDVIGVKNTIALVNVKSKDHLRGLFNNLVEAIAAVRLEELDSKGDTAPPRADLH